MMTSRVLLIEDNEVNSYLIRFVLEQAGYAVQVAANGLEGLEAARAKRPDLILMDIGMPVMDGYEATERLKADPDLSGVPVVALSAHAMEHENEREIQEGCIAQIEKPIDMKTFIRQVQGHLAAAAL
jgi:CheY-like chemotaxis protein